MVIESGSAGMVALESSVAAEKEHQGFVHAALLYYSQREYLDSLVRFVVDGLAMDERVLVAVPGEGLALLRDALCGAGSALPAGLQLADSTRVARNPSRFMALEASFAGQHPDRRVRIASEVFWPGRTPAEVVACEQHEALINDALERHQVTGLCLFDASRLDEDVLAGGPATHPVLWQSGSLLPNPAFAPQDVLERCNQPLSARPGAATYLVQESADLRPARSFAASYAYRAGMSRDVIWDLQLVATELASNGLMHTGGPCRLALWHSDDRLVCEARTSGRLDNPLVGRLNPGPSGPASRGLFLVNAVSELVRTHTTPAGTTIQAYLPFHRTSRPTR